MGSVDFPFGLKSKGCDLLPHVSVGGRRTKGSIGQRDFVVQECRCGDVTFTPSPTCSSPRCRGRPAPGGGRTARARRNSFLPVTAGPQPPAEDRHGIGRGTIVRTRRCCCSGRRTHRTLHRCRSMGPSCVLDPQRFRCSRGTLVRDAGLGRSCCDGCGGRAWRELRHLGVAAGCSPALTEPWTNAPDETRTDVANFRRLPL